MLVTLDGSYGEGGGQILRTSLSLAALTGRPFRLERIRAGRAKPGLRPQHLTAVQAAAAVCGATVQGATLNSSELIFTPQHRPQAGTYRFDVNQHAPHGSAGSTTLIAQTILWPLLFTKEQTMVTMKGGTHVPFSPSFHYLQYVALRTFRQLGVQSVAELHEWGWMPTGEGLIKLEIAPLTRLTAVQLTATPVDRVEGQAVVTNLPGHIPHRMARRADNLLEAAGVRPQIQARRLKSHSEGAGALGRPGLAAQTVAETAVDELQSVIDQQAAVDAHLADQLLLPMALAHGRSSFTTTEWTSHAQTNAALLHTWLGAHIAVERVEKVVEVTVDGVGFSW